MDERSVFFRVAAGEAGAAEECRAAYAPLVLALTRRFSGSERESEQLTGEILDSLIGNAGSFSGSRGSETSFVVGVARRHLASRFEAADGENWAVLEQCLANEPQGDEIRRPWNAARSKATGPQSALNAEQLRSVGVSGGGRGPADRLGLLGSARGKVRAGLTRLRRLLAQDGRGTESATKPARGKTRNGCKGGCKEGCAP